MNASPSISATSKERLIGSGHGFMCAAAPGLLSTVFMAAHDPAAAHTIAMGLAATGVGLNVAASRLVKGPIAKFYTVFLSIPAGMALGSVTGHTATDVTTALMGAFAGVACARGGYVLPQQFEKFQKSFDIARYTKAAVAGVALSSALALGAAFLQEPVSPASAVPAPVQPS